MSITLSGDFATLAQWAARLKDSSGVMPQIAEQLAEEMRNLTLEGFDSSKDPYGRAWAPRRSGGGSKLLVRTGAMRGSVTTSHGAREATVAVGQGYADFHQTGTSRMPQRMLVPNRSMPPKWRTRFDALADEILRDHFGG